MDGTVAQSLSYDRVQSAPLHYTIYYYYFVYSPFSFFILFEKEKKRGKRNAFYLPNFLKK